MDDLQIFETSFSEKVCTAAEQAIKYKFPKIQNLTVDMNEEGEVCIIFDETIYSQKQVQDFMNEFKKLKNKTMIKYKAFDKSEDFGIDINVQDLLTYEIANSWICQWIWIDWVQDLWAKRMANKVQRKYKKYVEFAKKLETANFGVS